MDGAGRRATDFFISRTGADAAIAVEVRDILVAAGYSVVLQDFDFKNRNFMEMMDASLASGARIIAILSQGYLASDHCAAEWYHPLVDDPLNKNGRLIVLRVAECAPQGLLKGIAYWDLTRLRGQREVLSDMVLAAVDRERRARLPLSLAELWQRPGTVVDDWHIRPTPGFTGRGDAIAAIDGALSEKGGAALVQPVAVHGLGGVGKSTIAREYAWRVSQVPEVYAGIWWLDAERDASGNGWPGIVEGLVRLGAIFIRDLDKAGDRTAAARHTLRFLNTAGFEQPWLLVYDNADDQAALDAWPPPKGAHVIVTSRESRWDAEELTPVEIETWPRADSLRFLRLRSGRPDLSDRDAERIADELGDLPLALAHAAAYLRDNDAAAPADYITDLRRQLTLVPVGARRAAPRAVLATLAQNIAQADARVPGARHLLSLAAFLAPEDIPIELFEQPAEAYPDDLAKAIAGRQRLLDALGALGQLSLIDYRRASNTFSLHRLVQAAAREEQGEARTAWAEAAVVALAHTLPGDPTDYRNWDRYDRLVAHTRVAITHAADEVGYPLAYVLTQLGTYTQLRASAGVLLAEILPLYERARATLDRLAKADPNNAGWQRDLSVSHDKLGGVLERAGRLHEAMPHYEADLAIAERLAALDPGNAGWHKDVQISRARMARLKAPGK